jgi:hypothetical protein
MAVNFTEVRVAGKNIKVPSVEIEQRTVIARGGFVKLASVFDETLAPGELVKNPATFVPALKRSGLKADVLTFFQRVPDTQPRFSYHYDWENLAVIPVTTFEDWWEKLPQEARKNTRRAAKRGVTVKVVTMDDALAHGIHNICNESPLRQGKRFWHYGKDFETVRQEHATYGDRSEFIGAYFENELVGFIKLVYVDELAWILSILSLNAHHDKRPMNALMTKTMEVCAQKRVKFLAYGNYIYGNKKDSTLVEFKRRLGFEPLDYPRYYVPLTLKGKIFTALRLYRGVGGLLPGPVVAALLKVREAFYRRKTAAVKEAVAAEAAAE